MRTRHHRSRSIGETAMASIYPPSTSEIAHKRRDLAPNQQAAFDAFSKAMFADGVLSATATHTIGVAVEELTPPPLWHQRPSLGGNARRRDARRVDGGNLGSGGNARRWRLCAFDNNAYRAFCGAREAVVLHHGKIDLLMTAMGLGRVKTKSDLVVM